MVPKIIAKGTSFKGAAQYLLHDKGGLDTSERVAWTDVRNLMSDDPELAWRIMASTAMDQSRLKTEAGIANTGRKSNKSVLHMSLAWHPEEAEGLSKEDMIDAASGAIKAIGADKHQVLMVAHDDEDHPHLHILCNRVSPENGVMLSSSNDRLKLSEWAQAYEMERGKVYCEDRVVNNERRNEGEYVKGTRDKSKHIVEAENVSREPSNDNRKASEVVKAAQIAQDRVLAQKSRKLTEARKRAWKKLEGAHKGTKSQISRQALQGIKKAKQIVANKYHPLRKELNGQFKAELAAFDERDKNILGKAHNALQAIKLARRLRGDDHQGQVLGRVFRVLASRGARREQVLKDHEYRKTLLRRAQKKEFEVQKVKHLEKRKVDIADARKTYLVKREVLVKRQAKQKAQMQEAWKERTRIRNAAYVYAKSSVPELKTKFHEAALQNQKKSGSSRSNFDHLRDKIRDDYESGADNKNNRDYENER